MNKRTFEAWVFSTLLAASAGAVAADPSWTLITVTYGGAVGEARSFKTERACLQAKSIAETGLTLEEVAKDRAARDEARSKFLEKWAADHPPRKPRTAAERNMQSAHIASSGRYVLPAGDGLVKDMPGAEDYPLGTSSLSHGWSVINPSDIKYARCVPE